MKFSIHTKDFGVFYFDVPGTPSEDFEMYDLLIKGFSGALSYLRIADEKGISKVFPNAVLSSSILMIIPENDTPAE